MIAKTKKQRLSDLHDHATLLFEACERFRAHNLIEIKNIATQLRVLVGKGRGNSLLFDLAQISDLKVYVLETFVELTLEEIDSKTNEVVQVVTKRALLTKPIPGQPTLPIISIDPKFAPWLTEKVFEEWLEKGFLMDWEVPNQEGQTPQITRLTPRKLIHAYADRESAHSDKDFSNDFGAPFEKEAAPYTFSGKPIIMPVTHNYLYQIGQVTAKIADALSNRIDLSL